VWSLTNLGLLQDICNTTYTKLEIGVDQDSAGNIYYTALDGFVATTDDEWGEGIISYSLDDSYNQYFALNITEYLFYQWLQPMFKTSAMQIETTLKFAVYSQSTGQEIEHLSQNMTVMIATPAVRTDCYDDAFNPEL
jgi:hypothetical protein